MKVSKISSFSENICCNKPNICVEIPLAFCQGNQRDANFQTGLQKYIIPAALVIIKQLLIQHQISSSSSHDKHTLDYRTIRGDGGECCWGSGGSGGQPRARRAERPPSGPDADHQPGPTVPSPDRPGDRQLLPVPVLRQKVPDLLPAEVTHDPAQRGAGESAIAPFLSHGIIWQ